MTEYTETIDWEITDIKHNDNVVTLVNKQRNKISDEMRAGLEDDYPIERFTISIRHHGCTVDEGRITGKTTAIVNYR